MAGPGNFFDQFDAPPGAVPLGPPNQKYPYEVDQARVSVPHTQAETRRTAVQTVGDQIDNAVKGQTAPYTVREAAAKTTTAETQAQEAARKIAEQQRADSLRQAAEGLNSDEILAAITKARGMANGWATGPVGSVLSGIPGTQAHDLQQQINTIAAGTTLGKLQSLRDQSATGASGLGQLSNREGELLRDSIAPLGQSQSTAAFNNNLNAVEEHYRKTRAMLAGADPRFPGVKEQFGISNALTSVGATQALAAGLAAAQRGGPAGVKRFYQNPNVRDLAKRTNTWFGSGGGSPGKQDSGWKIERVGD